MKIALGSPRPQLKRDDAAHPKGYRRAPTFGDRAIGSNHQIGLQQIAVCPDEIGDVLEVEDETFESPPETLQGVARELIRGAYKLKERLLLVLDTEKTVNIGA